MINFKKSYVCFRLIAFLVAITPQIAHSMLMPSWEHNEYQIRQSFIEALTPRNIIQRLIDAAVFDSNHPQKAGELQRTLNVFNNWDMFGHEHLFKELLIEAAFNKYTELLLSHEEDPIFAIWTSGVETLIDLLKFQQSSHTAILNNTQIGWIIEVCEKYMERLRPQSLVRKQAVAIYWLAAQIFHK